MVIKNHHALAVLNTPRLSSFNRLWMARRTFADCFSRTFNSFGVYQCRRVHVVLRGNSDAVKRVRVNLFNTSANRRQDPFRNNSNEQGPKQPNSGPNNNDPRRSAILLAISLTLTVFAYISIETSMKKTQAEMQARVESAQSQNDVISFCCCCCHK